MIICPRCEGTGYTVLNEPCDLCNASGDVIPTLSTCTNCKGRGCMTCANNGILYIPLAPTEPVRVVPASELKEAFQMMRVGYAGEDIIPHPWVLGSIAVLIQISEERTHESNEEGEWIRQTLDQCDSLVFDVSGIWCLHDGIGVRLYRYPIPDPV